MASLVAAATDRPAAAPTNASATNVTESSPASPMTNSPVPIDRQPSPMSVGLRAPLAAEAPRQGRQDDRRDRHCKDQYARLLRTVRAHVLEVLRDDEQRSVDT